jgi:hypothetical protein
MPYFVAKSRKIKRRRRRRRRRKRKIFKTEWTTMIYIIIGSTSNTVCSSKNDGIK